MSNKAIKDLTIKDILTTNNFQLNKNNIKLFMSNNLNILNELPKKIEEVKKSKNMVLNILKLFNLIPFNAKMLKTMNKIQGIEIDKTTKIQFLKLLENILNITTPLEVESMKFNMIVFFDNLVQLSLSNDIIIQIYSLMCLYHLEINHKITIPNYLNLLYSVLTPRLLYSPIMPIFYERLYKYISSSYIPLYISASFIKKSLRLTLEAPTGAIIILLHFVLKLLFALPQVHFLLKKPALPVYKFPEVDPFEKKKFSSTNKLTINLMETEIEKSFLWEHLLLQNHPHPKIALLAQSFPKHEDDKIEIPPEFNIKDINPKESPSTSTISININPFLIESNKQMVNVPNENDCMELGFKWNESLFDDYFD